MHELERYQRLMHNGTLSAGAEKVTAVIIANPGRPQREKACMYAATQAYAPVQALS